MRITGMEGVCKSGELGLRDPVLKHYSIDSRPNSQKAKTEAQRGSDIAKVTKPIRKQSLPGLGLSLFT